HRVVGARHGSPLVLRAGSERSNENFLASDALALARVSDTIVYFAEGGVGETERVVYLEEGDVVDLQRGKHWISHADANGDHRRVERPVRTVVAHTRAAATRPHA